MYYENSVRIQLEFCGIMWNFEVESVITDFADPWMDPVGII